LLVAPRRAQNRYREKQKAKAAATEQDYSEVAAELERMRLEHDRLQDQHEEMQRVLLVRDTAVEALETSKVRLAPYLAHWCRCPGGLTAHRMQRSHMRLWRSPAAIPPGKTPGAQNPP
jgi:hypothetical protein